MKKLSIDNGNSYTTKFSKAIKKLGWDTIVNFMDDDIREKATNIAPCTDREFLIYYLKLANDNLIIG